MRYDAFISYSHTQDQQLAAALEEGLQRMAKPWRKRRALEVFRDSSDLSVAPGLWSSIAAAMDESQWLILLASPYSVKSPWVEQELANFLATHTSDQILLVQTGGEVIWNKDANDFDLDQSTAIPPSLSGVFSEEPKFLDLRWAHTDTHLDLQHVRFKDAVAELAAPIHGVSKDDLIGEDVTLFRRAQRLRQLAIGTLTILTIAATTLGLVAVATADRALRAEKVAVVNEELALVQKGIAQSEEARAEMEAMRATAEADRAMTAEEDALEQRDLAEQETERALVAEQDAEAARTEAERQRDLAITAQLAEEAARLEAEAQRAAAVEAEAAEELARVIAEVQRGLAEDSASEALRQRDLAIEAEAQADAARIEEQTQREFAESAQKELLGALVALTDSAWDQALAALEEVCLDLGIDPGCLLPPFLLYALDPVYPDTTTCPDNWAELKSSFDDLVVGTQVAMDNRFDEDVVVSWISPIGTSIPWVTIEAGGSSGFISAVESWVYVTTDQSGACLMVISGGDRI